MGLGNDGGAPNVCGTVKSLFVTREFYYIHPVVNIVAMKGGDL